MNKQMKELVQDGFGIHNAGMLLSDCNIGERLFEKGVTRVLCCTESLAWGVNLPAYAVIIKGTQLYNASKGSFVDLGILDVLQIFGRAGRPQYENHGVGYICTTHDRLDHYVSAITQQHPIESQFIAGIVDSLNAEIALGTVRTVDEGVQWIGWTYLFVRMRKNPMVYGLTVSDVENDPFLGSKRHSLIEIAAKKLHEIGMISFDQVVGSLEPTELGRIASKYYIRSSSIEVFNQLFRSRMTEADALAMLSQSVEFDQIKVRDSELDELEHLQEDAPCQVKGGPTSTAGKVNILLQAHVSRAFIEDFALVSDAAYIAQNAARIVRALVEISIWKKFAETSRILIELSKCIEKKKWPFTHPLSQSGLSDQLIYDLDERAGELEVEDLAEMTPSEIASACRINDQLGGIILRAARQFPRLSFDYTLQPLTESLLRVRIHVTRNFDWSNKIHGHGEPFWVWIEDSDRKEILRITRIFVRQSAPSFDLDFILSFINTSGSLPEALCIWSVSDRWISSDSHQEVSLKDLALCPVPPQHTHLLELPLLSTSRLARLDENPRLIGLPQQLSPIESQCFHTLFHTPHNTLICGSERQALNRLSTISIARTLKLAPKEKKKRILVLTPKKSIAQQLGALLRRTLKLFSVKISVTVDPSGLLSSASYPSDYFEVYVTTPQIGLTMSASFYQSTILAILMDLHNMTKGYEQVVNHLIKKYSSSTRLIGFSHSLMDPTSLASWLRVEPRRVSNLSPASRSQPILVEFLPFNQSYSSSQWKVLVKPAWKLIQASSIASVLVFVPSKHQCRSVAQQLVQCSASSIGREGMIEPAQELSFYAEHFGSRDVADMLVHGVMVLEERMTLKEIRLAIDLFQRRKLKIVVLPCESCWKISSEQLKAELVIVLGTQQVVSSLSGTTDHGSSSKSVRETEPSELVQMQGFVGQSVEKLGDGKVCRFVVMCAEEQLEKYETFLKAGVPLESMIELDSNVYLDEVLRELLGTGKEKRKSRSDIMKCLSGTLLLERVRVNPLYYGINTRHGRGAEGSDANQEAWGASAVIDKWIERLVELSCVRSVGLEEVELTEIGKKVAQKGIHVDRIDQLRSTLKERSQSYSKKVQEQERAMIDSLTTLTDNPVEHLIGRIKEFYSKSPRLVRDRNPRFLTEMTEGSVGKANQLEPNEVRHDNNRGNVKEETGEKTFRIKKLLIDCFEVGWIPFNDSILAQEQVNLILQLIEP